MAGPGLKEICTALNGLGEAGSPRVVEPLFCPQGCINGPAMGNARNVFVRRSDVLEYAASQPIKPPGPGRYPQLTTKFQVKLEQEPEITEDQIRRALEMTGKAREEDQLNCGACGYANCREKAIAVIRGLAEPEMCIPHMKRLAEQRVDRIIETSPNGIVILDEHLRILNMNPAFRRFFMCSDAIYGQPISYLMDPDPFEQLAAGRTDLVETTVKHVRMNLVCHQIHYAMRDERQYVGIFVNMTKTAADKEKLDRLRTQTAQQARSLLEHQVEMAQTIAKFLGESTAQSEALLDRLILLAGGDTPEE
jgi:uncharacterized Fe-S cluster-containing protein